MTREFAKNEFHRDCLYYKEGGWYRTAVFKRRDVEASM